MRGFLQSQFYESTTVLGLELLPYSIGHDLILQTMDCNYFTNKEITHHDLILGVNVCSNLATSFFEHIEKAKFWKDLAKWSKRCRKLVLMDEHEKFSEYLTRNRSVPEYDVINESASSMEINAPFTQVLKVKLMSQFGLSEKEALNYSFNRAAADCFTLSELSGLIKFRDKGKFSELQEAANEFARKYNAGKVGAKTNGNGGGQ